MIRWFKSLARNATAESETKDVSKTTQSVIGIANKTLATILRDFGRFAFRIESQSPESIKERFETWSNNILNATQIPNSSVADGQRDWTGVVKAFADHRKLESEYVTVNFNDLRLLVWTFSRLLGRELSSERRDAVIVETELKALRTATESDSLEEMRRVAKHAIKVLADLALARRTRHDEHLNELGQKLRVLQKELDFARSQLTIDPLTRLCNRAALDEHLDKIVEISLYSGKPTCVMMIDIDYFKKINDTYGHQAGDAILRDVAAVIIDNFPRKTDFCARYGGEEFTVNLQETEIGVARALTEKLCESIRSTVFSYAGRTIPITVSIGVAELKAGETVQAWIERADKALYVAKKSGRDRVVIG